MIDIPLLSSVGFGVYNTYNTVKKYFIVLYVNSTFYKYFTMGDDGFL